MNTKIVLAAILIIAAVGGAVWYWVNNDRPQKQVQDNVGGAPAVDSADGSSHAALPDGEYVIDSARSELKWEAKKKLIVGYTDRGTIKVSDGSFTVADGAIVSGSAVVDVNSIAVASTGSGKDESRLARHLKSPDFFDATTYPTAKIVLTKSEKLEGDISRNDFNILADLTIKGITNPVVFPAKIYQSSANIIAEAAVALDRSKWNVRYGSETFFDNLGNNIIENNFTVYLKAVAVKKSP